MANDPNRDLLPVREDYKKGAGDRIDHQILSKLSRCELEDKFLRLLDEQTSLKKLSNFQEEKIKRLGTKLLRLINDKKNGRKNSEQNKETEDLHLRIIELEHENYALKDKNTVLKQQVATHSSHLSVYRSPVRSAHTSPLMSIRQSSQPVQNEVAYESSKKIGPRDVQLQEAENHIKKLNKEIHALHNKIDYLQQDLEKSNLDHKKTKVAENIELIRLQRSLKHQAMQIATLQAQVKNSENSQKKLKEELVKAHKENEEALQLIAAKQSEILNLGSKLEEKNLNRLQEDELRQRVNDLKLERDLLKERSDFLMQTVTARSEETEKVNELKKLLNEEKLKTEELEKDLEAAKKAAEETENVNELKKLLNEEKLKTEELEKDLEAAKKAAEETKKIRSVSVSTSVNLSKSQNVPTNAIATVEKVELDKVMGEDESSAGLGTPLNSPEGIMSKGWKNTSLKTVYENPTERLKSKDIFGMSKISQIDGHILSDKLKLERELQYMRDMLRSQTARCEAQQEEISRLMTELRVSDAKCNDTLEKLDQHLKVFQELEGRTQQRTKPEISEPKPSDINQDSSKTTNSESEKSDKKPSANPEIKAKVPSASKNNVLLVPSIKNSRAPSPREILLSTKSTILDKRELMSNELDSKRPSTGQPKKRFVDQVFLDSSDEEVNELPFHKESFIKKLEELEVKKNSGEASKETDNFSISKSAASHRFHESPSSLSSKFPSNSSLSIREPIVKTRGAGNRKPSGEAQQHEEKVIISIMTFKVNPSSSLGTNDNIQLLFVDFSFLDVYGEETETPESLPKPRSPEEMCEFNFSKAISLNDSKLRILRSLANKPDIDLVVFKVITDSEDFDQANEIDCEEVGVAVVTVKQFLDHFNKGSLVIPVKNVSDTKEVVGALTVKFDGTLGVFNAKN